MDVVKYKMSGITLNNDIKTIEGKYSRYKAGLIKDIKTVTIKAEVIQDGMT